MEIEPSRGRHALSAVLAAVVVASGVWAAPVGQAAAAPDKVASPRSYQEYVALGDSWTAAVALLPLPTAEYAPAGCLQQPYNYPHQVAAALKVPHFRDASCGGATTAEMTKAHVTDFGDTNAPQFDRLTPTTDLVTVGLGGNDIGLAGGVLSCLSLSPVDSGPGCKNKLDAVIGQIPSAERALRDTVKGIRQRSPKAQIFVVDYLDVVPAIGCWPTVPITNADMARLRRAFTELHAMLARATKAAGVGAHFVDTYSTSGGHDVCKGPLQRWAEGLIPLSLNSPSLAVPFHPNSAGASAQASRVLRSIRAVPPMAGPMLATAPPRATYAIAHRVLTTQGVTDAVANGANAIEIDLCAYSASGWWADHDCNTGLSAGDSAVAMFQKIRAQVQAGKTIAFVWLDIKNPDYCTTTMNTCSTASLRQLARTYLEPVGVEVLLGFYGTEGGFGWNSIKDDLSASEGVVASGTLAAVRDIYTINGNGIATNRRVMDYGYFNINTGFGNCWEGSYYTCTELRQAASPRDAGELSKTFSWTTTYADDERVNQLLGTAKVDGLIYGFRATYYYDHPETREAAQDIRDWVAAHPDTNRMATMDDTLF